MSTYNRNKKLCSQLNIGNYTQIVVLGLGTRCPPRDPSLLVSCSPVPHHVIPEGPLEGHNSFKSEMKPVWFRICESYGEYYITMFYDNEYNHANGEDL